jgi:hypothetical protein
MISKDEYSYWENKMSEAHDEFYVRYYVGHETEENGKLVRNNGENSFTYIAPRNSP